jgi:hypothetical protein
MFCVPFVSAKKMPKLMRPAGRPMYGEALDREIAELYADKVLRCAIRVGSDDGMTFERWSQRR